MRGVGHCGQGRWICRFDVPFALCTHCVLLTFKPTPTPMNTREVLVELKKKINQVLTL